MKKTVPLIVLFALLASCGSNIVFEDSVTFDGLYWERRHYIEFEVPVSPREAGYDFAVIFAHNGAYAFDHINMNITFYMPAGAMRSRDYEFRLQDEHGEWMGERHDPFIEVELPVTSGLRFLESGICRVRVENKMTRFPSSGEHIQALGLVVRKAKQ